MADSKGRSFPDSRFSGNVNGKGNGGGSDSFLDKMEVPSIPTNPGSRSPWPDPDKKDEVEGAVEVEAEAEDEEKEE